jgi:2-keto-4-pentenoate hydratase/2-oxohepta-3-ene-1,7-dioic acid hydratase in catechol pathway
MKIASFTSDGKARIGIAAGDEIKDITGLVRGAQDLRQLLAVPDWQELAAGADGPAVSIDRVTFLPVAPHADAKILALGFAYRSHAEETGHGETESPMFFSKFPQALLGHRQTLVKPAVSDKFDFEGEVAVVIGKTAHAISKNDALSCVTGYTIMMDGSIRDWQKHSVTAGKNFDGLTPLGPWMVTADEAGAHDAFELETRLNGELMQKARTSELIWSIPYLVSYCSTFTTLHPGDVISTGTPAGVGHKRNPQVFMKAGDVIEVTVSGIGTLSNTVS